MVKNAVKSHLLKAVALNPKTHRPVRITTGRDVIYGYKDFNGKITPLDMLPQKYAKTETRQLQALINRNKLTTPVNTIFFEKKTNTIERYKGGEIKKERVWSPDDNKYITKESRAKKGEEKWIYKDNKKSHKAKKLKITFKPPTYRIHNGKRSKPVYRKISMEIKNGKFKKSVVDWRLQERDKFERLEDQIIAGAIQIKSSELEGATDGYKTKSIIARGATLSHTLSTIKPPDTYEGLINKGVTAIGLDAVVNFKDAGEWKSISIRLPAIDINQYSDISNILSRSIRSELLNHGKTFTKMATFKKIKEEIKKDCKINNEPYFPKWKKTGVVMSGGKVHDMTTAINKAKSPYDEIKRGDLKVSVTFRYYKGGNV